MSNWPTQQIPTGNFDTDTDTPSRDDFLKAVQALNFLIAYGACAILLGDNTFTGKQKFESPADKASPVRLGTIQRVSGADKQNIPNNNVAAVYYALSNGANQSGADLFNATFDQMVAPASGMYRFDAVVLLRPSASSAFSGQVRVVLDVTSHDRSGDEFGCIDIFRSLLPSSNVYISVKLSGERYLNAGDKVGIYVANMAASNSVDALTAFFSARGPY